MTALCQAWSPWHMLRRATFMPAAASSPSVAADAEAGPMVQMIFVRRVERKPGGQGGLGGVGGGGGQPAGRHPPLPWPVFSTPPHGVMGARRAGLPTSPTSAPK